MKSNLEHEPVAGLFEASPTSDVMIENVKSILGEHGEAFSLSAKSIRKKLQNIFLISKHRNGNSAAAYLKIFCCLHPRKQFKITKEIRRRNYVKRGKFPAGKVAKLWRRRLCKLLASWRARGAAAHHSNWILINYSHTSTSPHRTTDVRSCLAMY